MQCEQSIDFACSSCARSIFIRRQSRNRSRSHFLKCLLFSYSEISQKFLVLCYWVSLIKHTACIWEALHEIRSNKSCTNDDPCTYSRCTLPTRRSRRPACPRPPSTRCAWATCYPRRLSTPPTLPGRPRNFKRHTVWSVKLWERLRTVI